MSILLATWLSCAAAADLWVAPPTDRLFAVTLPPVSAERSVRLYAARGEFESFQVGIRAGADGIEAVRAVPPDRRWDPHVYSVEPVESGPPSPRAMGRASAWPDKLSTFASFAIPPNETAGLWITLRVPRDAKPGIYSTELGIELDKRHHPVRITIEVFGFTLPEVPSLRTRFWLDRKSIQDTLAIAPTSMTDWSPIYDFLARYPISYAVWDGGPLVWIDSAGAITTALEIHLDYAARRMNTVELSPGPLGATAAPFDAALGALATATLPNFTSGRSTYSVAATPDRNTWAPAKDQLAQLAKRLSGVTRLFEGPVHPDFEDSTDIYAAPFAEWRPEIIYALRNAASLRTTIEYPGTQAAASTEATPALEAYDGSPYTAWSPATTDRNPALNLTFPDLVLLESLKLVYPPNSSVPNVQLRTTGDGERFSRATVSWRERDGVSEGTLRVAKNVRGIRLEFPRDVAFALAEVIFGEREWLHRDGPIRPWLRLVDDEFPSFEIDAAPLEYRLAPWVCWQMGLDGFAAGYLNAWPPFGAANPEAWTRARSLVYSGSLGPAPSVALELVRDGVEDYEYLVALEGLLSASPNADPAYQALLRPLAFAPDDSAQYVASLAQEIWDRHKQMGRAIDALGDE
ncbi:MAG: hypothetical protein AAB353_04605 [Candidatus Hydrogenedentota bacterium]